MWRWLDCPAAAATAAAAVIIAPAATDSSNDMRTGIPFLPQAKSEQHSTVKRGSAFKACAGITMQTMVSNDNIDDSKLFYGRNGNEQ